jgi:dihydroceramidase
MYVHFPPSQAPIPRGSSHSADTTQLLDELAMIYTTCVMFYAIFSHGRATSAKVLIALLVVLLATFITLYYHYLKDPLFHQNMFALLTAIVFFRSMYAMEVTLRPSRRAKANESRKDQRDLAILKTMWQMIPVGLASVAFGFLIWNLDNVFCPTIRHWRREVGLPWGILLEGHGWW